MHYTISYLNPHQHLVDIELFIDNIDQPRTALSLPAWRPGRYELGNFIQNIKRLQVTDYADKPVPFKKSKKDQWEVDTSGIHAIKVIYSYFAFNMDAGSSWLDENQLYLNFINCMIFVPERLNEPCMIDLKIPDHYLIACGLEKTDHHKLKATSFYHLVDCPMIAGDQLQHFSYDIGQTTYHLWLMGECNFDWQRVKSDFTAFTKEQLQTMDKFPSNDYHFMFQILPYKIYHGVEHYNSTVIVLGPGESMNESPLYEDFLGVSSHELFHTWNAIRIKPKEFIPYDFTQENYFETGFAVEGLTTYYGDLFLVRSGVFEKEWYFDELKKLINRHLHNFGRFNLSLAQSSYDLWVDGYKKGTPDRKVSIYTKGALVALLLDLKIRASSGGKHSLDHLMRKLWENFGNARAGYSLADIKKLAGQLADNALDKFFDDLVEGIAPIEPYFTELLTHVGCELASDLPDQLFENLFGFKTAKKENQHIITQLHPDSVAAKKLSLDDEIIAVNGWKVSDNLSSLIGNQEEITLSLFRLNRLKEITLKNEGRFYFENYEFRQISNPSVQQIENFENWLKCKW